MICCSNCTKSMPSDPDGHEIPAGWSVIRIEKHHKTTLTISYLYLCPGCDIAPMSIQTTLSPETT